MGNKCKYRLNVQMNDTNAEKNLTNWYVPLAHSVAYILRQFISPGQNGHYFGRWYFQMYFIESKWKNSYSNLTVICFQESTWQ